MWRLSIFHCAALFMTDSSLDSPPAPDPTSNIAEGVYSDESWSEADDEELQQFLNGGFDDDVDGEGGMGGFLAEIEDDLADFLEEASADPLAPRKAKGEPLWIGFDAEWQYDEASDSNTILTIQLYVPNQEALSQAPEKAEKRKRLSRMVRAFSPTREGRPSLLRNLRQILTEALEHHLIAEEPRLIYVVGFGLRFDLGALGDFPELKNQIDSVSGKVATVGSPALMEFPKVLATEDDPTKILIGLHFIDVAAHVPPGKALRDIGKQVGFEKLEIPAPYSIERMSEYLEQDPAGFEAYAMRDAEIAVLYARRLADFAKRKLKINTLPATASGLALKWYLSILKELEIDRFAAFGLHKIKREAWHNPTKRKRVIRDVEPTPMRRLQEAFLTDCYAGGRNESFWLGPTPVGQWFDYDLAGAYSTGLADLPLIDFENPRPSTEVKDFLGHVAGYALVKFKHRPDTRFPVFAISRGGKGLIFPLEGLAYATAPEIQAAHDLKCEMDIKWGVIYGWRRLPDDPVKDGVPSFRLFGPYVQAARKLRNELKVFDPRAGKMKDTLESLAAKLYANGLYGKVCQSLRAKNVYDTRRAHQVRLKPSSITNPAIAAHVTGFIRAILAEILNKIPRHRTVLSVTTDGFLTDALRTELDESGPLCQRFIQLCNDIADGCEMLEKKHEVAQVVCMKTRGQLTGLAATAEDGKLKEIILAKAGVQPVIEAPNSIDEEEYKRLQNEKMLNLYLDRRPGKKVLLKQFPALRDQWEKGIDLHKFERHILLSLEPDLKRKLVEPQMIEVASRKRPHLAMSSVPWQTVEEFDAARACMDNWRRKHCLKTVEDWHAFETAQQFGAVRTKRRKAGETAMNRRAGKDESDVLRRMFLRAYAQEQLGLKKTMKYKELAEWLTGLTPNKDYKTEPREVMSARSQKLVLRHAVRTDKTMQLWGLLQAKFPDADLEPLLEEDGGLR